MNPVPKLGVLPELNEKAGTLAAVAEDSVLPKVNAAVAGLFSDTLSPNVNVDDGKLLLPNVGIVVDAVLPNVGVAEVLPNAGDVTAGVLPPNVSEEVVVVVLPNPVEGVVVVLPKPVLLNADGAAVVVVLPNADDVVVALPNARVVAVVVLPNASEDTVGLPNADDVEVDVLPNVDDVTDGVLLPNVSKVAVVVLPNVDEVTVFTLPNTGDVTVVVLPNVGEVTFVVPPNVKLVDVGLLLLAEVDDDVALFPKLGVVAFKPNEGVLVVTLVPLPNVVFGLETLPNDEFGDLPNVGIELLPYVDVVSVDKPLEDLFSVFGELCVDPKVTVEFLAKFTVIVVAELHVTELFALNNPNSFDLTEFICLLSESLVFVSGLIPNENSGLLSAVCGLVDFIPNVKPDV